MAPHNNKFLYYFKNTLQLGIPNRFFRSRLHSKIQQIDRYAPHAINERVDYYIKRSTPFSLENRGTDFKTFSRIIRRFYRIKKKTYYFDLRRFYRYFPEHYRLAHVFGDVTKVPEIPAIVKSRPIEGDNENSVLMKLDEVRHFYFIRDSIPFEAKMNRLVWRGKVKKDPRRTFVRACHRLPSCDIGQTSRSSEQVPWQKPRLTIAEQLKYKFIASLEGNDVATNLKWIMSSNSLCFMPRPRYETWFMEGKLQPGVHYVELADDFSDIEEKIDYYSRNTEEAGRIIHNAHRYVQQFLYSRREELIALLVLKRYFELSGQTLKN
ncbi:MAG: lipopolysaccharide A protein [Verrucomicrobia bacterium]|nr:lipopolysaccharide A protein [Verrucomicrobiota bacterium]